MLVKQSNDTFIRTTDTLGYICNQKTKFERMYNETGVDYLRTLSRVPTRVEAIVSEQLLSLYDEVSFDDIYCDFCGFLYELADNGFVFIGESEEQLVSNEDKWYSNYYTQNTHSYHQDIAQSVEMSTQETALDRFGEQPYLMSLQFELTSRCNERCIHCYIPNAKKDKGIDLPIGLFKRTIDQFSDMGGLQVSLSGGEIFLHDNIIDMIKYCREKDMQITLLSNLISLNEEQLKAIKDANVSMIQASLYSMDAEIHDSITTVKGSYNYCCPIKVF